MKYQYKYAGPGVVKRRDMVRCENCNEEFSFFEACKDSMVRNVGILPWEVPTANSSEYGTKCPNCGYIDFGDELNI